MMMWVAWLPSASSHAQDYAFPSQVDFGDFYPTAYKDQGGVDWNCGTITYPGHQGSDFGVGGFAGMDAGRTVTAAAEGTVVYTNDGEFDRCTNGDCAGGGGFGNWVKIEHPDGKETIYGHLKQWSVAVAVGDEVQCGTVLGEVGSSGYSTGPHLHFEVRVQGVAEDPFDGPCSAPPSYWRSQGPHGDLPDPICGDAPECVPSGVLTCGAEVDGRNDAAGSTDATRAYGCSDFVYTGPEQVFTFTPDRDTAVALSLTGLSADLDLMVVDEVACDGQGCVAGSSNPDAGAEAAGFDALAGVTYYVVVDGWEDAVSDFHLALECSEGGAGSIDTGTPQTPAEEHSAVASGDTGAGPIQKAPPPAPCGCGSGSGSAGWLLGVFPLVSFRRRSR